jgi:asparagine synthase (glutamine-hydrolysing)
MENLDELGGFNFFEVRYFLPDELLLYGDKLSMAHGLEVRVPYLDQKIVEYVERLPAHYKIKNLSRKYLHRRVCKEFLPEEFIKRRKKNFAGNVTDDWFREAYSGIFKDLFQDNNSMMYTYLNSHQVRSLVSEHQTGKSDNHKILYSLVVLEEWMRTYMK